MAHRKYTLDFKREALELWTTSDKSAAQVEQDLGITAGLLSKWKKRYKPSESEGFELSDLAGAQAEVKRLRRENTILKQECDILKKAISICVQQ